MVERRGKRIRLDLPVQISALTKDHTVEWVSEGRLRDLSAGGCAFYHPRDIPVGQRLQMRIVLDENHAFRWKTSELHAVGAVIRSVHENNEYLLSVRFTPSKTPHQEPAG
jgi:c-di-GMP-binding flagellar brake protein YcgR